MKPAGIAVSDLSKAFDPGATVLDGVDVSARGGTLSLVVGAPGSGKSTLVRCLTGVYRPDAGTITYRLGSGAAVDLTAADARTVAWLRNRHLASFDGVLPAAPQLPTAVATARAARCTRPAAVAALGRLRASELATVPIGRLRTHERLTVALAAALLAQRPFVVLDDPERSADADSLTKWVQRLVDGGAAVVLTATPGGQFERLATAVGDLREGQIAWRKP